MEEDRTPHKSGLLTARRIATTPPNKGDVWLSDDHGLRGTGRLLLRITPGGTRRFHFRYTGPNGRVTVPLGPYSRTAREGYLTLAQARRAVTRQAALLELDKAGPNATSSTAPLPSSPTPATGDERTGNHGTTVLQLCDIYVDDLRKRKRSSANEVAGNFKRYVAPSDIANILARELLPEQATALLRGLIDRGIGRSVARLRSQLHAAYETALQARLNPAISHLLVDSKLTVNPIASIPSLSTLSTPRERALNERELHELWRRLNAEQQSVDDSMELRAVRLALLLAGQRGEQLVRVGVADVDLDSKTILLLDPKGRRAVARQHLLPLQGAALAEVRWLVQHALEIDSPFLFSRNKKSSEKLSFNSVSNVVTEIRKEMVRDGTALGHFQFSDLRRTAETRLAQLGVSTDIRAQLQSHGLGGVQQRHYDKYEYMKEKRTALRKWEKYLTGSADV